MHRLSSRVRALATGTATPLHILHLSEQTFYVHRHGDESLGPLSLLVLLMVEEDLDIYLICGVHVDQWGRRGVPIPVPRQRADTVLISTTT